MADCPRCSEALTNATACKCGWKSRSKTEKLFEQPTFIQCRDEACRESANQRIRVNGGWENACQTHADAHRSAEARQRCQELGLDTPEKQRDYVRTHLKSFIRRQHDPV